MSCCRCVLLVLLPLGSFLLFLRLHVLFLVVIPLRCVDLRCRLLWIQVDTAETVLKELVWGCIMRSIHRPRSLRKARRQLIYVANVPRGRSGSLLVAADTLVLDKSI